MVGWSTRNRPRLPRSINDIPCCPLAAARTRQLPTKWIVVLYQPAARGRDWIITYPIARHGQRPHQVQRDRTGTWEVSGLAIGVEWVRSTMVRIGKRKY